MTIFDTNILIDYLRGSEEARRIIQEHADDKGPAITVISAYELVKGLSKTQEDTLNNLFKIIKIYDLNFNSMIQAGELYQKLKKSGELLSDADVLMVGISIENNEILVTKDNDFEGLKNDKIIVVE